MQMSARGSRLTDIIALILTARMKILAMLTLLAIVACTGQEAQPPTGAVIADAAYPPIGATWRVRITDDFSNHTREVAVSAVPVEFNGHPAYGLLMGQDTNVLNPTTFNRMANLHNGKVTFTELPDEGQFSWPLWVGKSWTSTSQFSDPQNAAAAAYSGTSYRNHTVAAYEEVTVPAGTFKAFRIEQTPGQNQAVSTTTWYAPDAKIVVKFIGRRLSYHYLGPAQSTTELLVIPK